MIREETAANARRLLSDAELLFAADRYRSCAALAVIAIEEVGITIMKSLAQPRWKGRSFHTTKQKHVGHLILAQVLGHAVGQRIELPRQGDNSNLGLDAELIDFLFPRGRDENFLERFAGYLVEKSDGTFDEAILLEAVEYQRWLQDGYLDTIKESGLYTEMKGHVGVHCDRQLAEKILRLARYSVAMCNRL